MLKYHINVIVPTGHIISSSLSAYISYRRLPVSTGTEAATMSKCLVAIALIVMLGSAHAHLGCKVSCECGYGHHTHPTASACGSTTELTDYLVSHSLIKPFLCQICRELIALLPAVVNEHTVQLAFDKLCDKLSNAGLKLLCKAAARRYSGLIAQKINEGVDRAHICEKLGVC